MPVNPDRQLTMQKIKHRISIDFDGYSCYNEARTMVLDSLTVQPINNLAFLPEVARSLLVPIILLPINDLDGPGSKDMRKNLSTE